MAQEEAAERFWRYALSVYGQSAAKQAFLKLQDVNGADVPMLLWCLWTGAEGRIVTAETMSEAIAFSKVWRAGAVLPMRSLRKNLKAGIPGAPESLAQSARKKVAETEQSLERLQMDHLASLAGKRGQPSAALARTALHGYADAAGLQLDAMLLDTVLGHAQIGQSLP